MKTISLLEILPDSIKNDEKIKALCNALDIELKKLSLQTKLPLHLPRLNELPHKVLDELAEGYHVDFYQPEKMSIETKRLLISEALHEHFKKGTKFALEKLLNTLSRGANVTEWFEYGGRPYHFKVNLQGLPDFGDDGNILINAIECAKNLRSWCDDFDFDLSKEHPDEILHVGFLQLFLGKLLYELNAQFTDAQKLKFWSTELFSGNHFYNLETENTCNRLNLRAGFIFLESGNIKYDAEFETEDDSWYKLWLLWLRTKWKQWSPARIIFDDEDDEPEPEILSGNFLRLYLDYHNSDYTRVLTVYDPRDDLTGDDINALNVDGLFVKRKKYLSNRIFRATYCNQTKIKVL